MPDMCPWWLGYLLISPLRRLRQKPEQIVGPWVQEGMTVLEPGPGMGFFTLELARRVGSQGKVIAVDVQPRMLAELGKRAAKAGLAERIELRQPQGTGLDVDDRAGTVDFVLAFAVVHELPDAERFFKDAFAALIPGGQLLLSEPSGHVRQAAWDKTIGSAQNAGFRKVSEPVIASSRSAVLCKPA